jgi:hypothetical protein
MSAGKLLRVRFRDNFSESGEQYGVGEVADLEEGRAHLLLRRGIVRRADDAPVTAPAIEREP